MISWIIFAFSGPICWAIATHMDKYLVERYFKYGDVTVLMIFTALIGLLLLPFIFFYHPEVFALDIKSILVIALSGILYMTAMVFYLRALQSEEASAVVPFFQTVPLFGFVLAYVVLGEILSRSQLIGGALILSGAVILSLKFGRKKTKIKKRLVLLMVICSFLLAISSIIFKFFAIRDEFWITTFWMYAGEALFGFILLAIPSYFKQFSKMLRLNTGAVLAINGVDEIINLAGGIGVNFAVLLAPISLVQAISSTSILFVFLFGILLTIFFPKLGKEDLSARNLIQKGTSAIFIILGVIIISR